MQQALLSYKTHGPKSIWLLGIDMQVMAADMHMIALLLHFAEIDEG